MNYTPFNFILLIELSNLLVDRKIAEILMLQKV